MRKVADQLFVLFTALCAVASCAVLILLVGAIARGGSSALDWTFLTEQIRLVGAAGGIFYNIVGTLILMLAALIVCTPIAVSTALLCGVYGYGSPWRERALTTLYLLNGVPSILFGIVGLIVFVNGLGWGKSWLTGGVLLGVMMLPTVTVAFVERIESIPRKYIEAAAGLGLHQSRIIWSVIVPQSLSGLVTGLLLGLARAAGETAPIMFTATIFAGATIPHGVRESPVLSLPYHIFILAQDSFDPSVGSKLWATALVMVAIVLVLSIAALPLRLRAYERSSGND